MKTVFSLGSNMGDPFAHLRDAVRLIAETPGIHDVVVSPVYVTAPIGGVEQDDFLNLIVVATSDLPPSVLLSAPMSSRQPTGAITPSRMVLAPSTLISFALATRPSPPTS